MCATGVLSKCPAPNSLAPTLRRIKQKTEGIRSTYTLASSAWKAMHLQHEIEALQRKEETRKLREASSPAGPSDGGADAPDPAADLMQNQLPLMLDTMWAANVLDIQGAVSKACGKVRTSHKASRRAGLGAACCGHPALVCARSLCMLPRRMPRA